MSTSEIPVQLRCDNAAAELLLVNGEFRVVAMGTSPLNAKVPPGIYALKARIGSQVNETLEVIDGSRPHYDLDAPEFESPMPLYHTRTSREYHAGSVSRLTQPGQPPIELGSGSAVMLYVRDTSRRNFSLRPEEKEAYARNFAGFQLLDAQGNQLVDFDQVGIRQIDEGYSGAHVRLNPGSYVLSWKARRKRETRIALHAAPNWALQVYLRLQAIGADSPVMQPDFSEGAFVYDGLHAGYSPGREDFRLLEAARLALVDRRNVASDAMLGYLTGKFENPMLGIYASHMLAAATPVNLATLGTVITNTSKLLGTDHPDLVALAWIYESKAKKRPEQFDDRPWAQILEGLKGPPLLLQGWDALLACATSNSVAIEKLPAFRIAGDIAASGIVLTWEHRNWKPPRPHPAPAAAATEGAVSLGAAIWRYVAPRIVGRRADGSLAPIPSVDVKIGDITTPEAAASAMKLLVKKAPWERWLALVHEDQEQADSVASFSPLQRDLISALARASLDPDVSTGIDGSYIENVMLAHRVPLSTLATALRVLDMAAVSLELFQRLKVALAAPAERRIPTLPDQRDLDR